MFSDCFEALGFKSGAISINGQETGIQIELVKKLAEGGFSIVYEGKKKKRRRRQKSQKESAPPLEAVEVFPSPATPAGEAILDLSTTGDGLYAVKKCHFIDMEGKAKIETEIEFHKRLGSSHDKGDRGIVLPLIDYCYDAENQDIYLIFPYFQMGSLHSNKISNLQSLMKMPDVETCIWTIFRDICIALRKLHYFEGNLKPNDPASLVGPFAHRDLKPENILLHHIEQDANGHVLPVIIDLGSVRCSRVYVESYKQAMQIQDDAAENCSMFYRAPELFDLKTRTQLDERTDIWSLGCILYFMAYGENPFERTFNQSNGGDSITMIACNCKFTFPNDIHPVIQENVKWLLQTEIDKRPFLNEVIEKCNSILAK